MPRRLPYTVTLTTLALAVAFVGADTIIVTSDSGGYGGPDCTIRNAIIAANTDTPSGGCPAGNGADTIELPANATIVLTGVAYVDVNGRNGLPPIASAITINGNEATIERSLADGTSDFRICVVFDELILNNVTVANGEADGSKDDGVGGGLYISMGATAALTDVSISENSATLAGGGIGISSFNLVTLTSCMINGNSAGFLGGGIVSSPTTDLSLTDTTVCGNAPDQIVGDYTDGGGNLILRDCTPCVGDFDGDDEIGPIDLAFMLGLWGPCPESCEPGDPLATCPADLDGNCEAGPFDLALLLGNWGPCP